jgi:hypothetical protein
MNNVQNSDNHINITSPQTYRTYVKKVSKVIPVTGRGGVREFQMSRIPHLLNNRFTDGVRLSSGRALHPEKNSGTRFCYGLSKPQGHSSAGRIR